MLTSMPASTMTRTRSTDLCPALNQIFTYSSPGGSEIRAPSSTRLSATAAAFAISDTRPFDVVSFKLFTADEKKGFAGRTLTTGIDTRVQQDPDGILIRGIYRVGHHSAEQLCSPFLAQ